MRRGEADLWGNPGPASPSPRSRLAPSPSAGPAVPSPLCSILLLCGDRSNQSSPDTHHDQATPSAPSPHIRPKPKMHDPKGLATWSLSFFLTEFSRRVCLKTQLLRVGGGGGWREAGVVRTGRYLKLSKSELHAFGLAFRGSCPRVASRHVRTKKTRTIGSLIAKVGGTFLLHSQKRKASLSVAQEARTRCTMLRVAHVPGRPSRRVRTQTHSREKGRFKISPTAGSTSLHNLDARKQIPWHMCSAWCASQGDPQDAHARENTHKSVVVEHSF